jgi:zinc D-Ala-D-Ala carboxypeptidase
MDLKYFKLSEFDSPDLPGSGSQMDEQFLQTLDKVREVAQIPFHVNSGYRSSYQNKLDGGKPDSAHLRGKASDIEAIESFQKYRGCSHTWHPSHRHRQYIHPS